MAGRTSRRKLAAYCAEELINGRDIAKRLAAYLVESRRTREYELIARDIELALAERGVLVADVTSSKVLSDTSRKAITSYLESTTHAKAVHLRESVEPELLGGVKVAVPGSELDASLRHKLNQLKASKI